VTTLTQPEPDWLDLTEFQDVVTWLEIKEFSAATTSIAYQTSPSKDDSLFFNMAPPVTAALGVTTTIMLKDATPAGYPPCGKWFRWQIVVTGGVSWDLTFRIWIAANVIGNRVAMSPATTLADLENEGYRYGYGECPPGSTQTSTPQGPSYGGPQGGGAVTNPGPKGPYGSAGVQKGNANGGVSYNLPKSTVGGSKTPPTTAK
jgi:hypothetical protein